MDEHHFNEGTSAFRQNFPRLLPAPLEITSGLIAAQSSYSPVIQFTSLLLPAFLRSKRENGMFWANAFVVVLEMGWDDG